MNIENKFIKLSESEIQSNLSRVRCAEGLILQLPKDHEGRNSWLLNYGVKEEAKDLRKKHNLKFTDYGYAESRNEQRKRLLG